jgi:lysophospholipid acyltransferase (LPLAT)-like uncharacterized protein
MKRVLQHPTIQAVLASLLSRYLRFALGTTRWTLEGDANLAPFAAGRPGVVAFWHERLPMMPALLLHARRTNPGLRAHILASRHRDGRFLGEIMRRFGLGVAHGSTARDGQDKGGATGARALLSALTDGDHAIITPDGPRGPRRLAAPGVAHLAARAGVSVLPCAGQTRWRLVLPTWDRMVVPLPFGRGALVCLPPIAVIEPLEALARIAAALNEAADAADALCG